MDELGFYVPSTVFQSFRDDYGLRRKKNKHDVDNLILKHFDMFDAAMKCFIYLTSFTLYY